MQIRKLTTSDIGAFREVVKLFKEVFEMKDFAMPQEAHLRAVLKQDNFIGYAAFDGDTIVGSMTAHILPSCYSTRPVVYLYDLAVKASHQRQGIGRKMIEALSAFCNAQNISEFFVQADAADIHALEFYKSTGGTRADVVHYTYLIQ